MAFEVWPGPMEGVGRGEFAQAAIKLSLTGCWMTPFIRITETIPSHSKLIKSVSAYLKSGVPVVVQLMGNDPDLLGQCGKILIDDPAVSGININMGCPSSRVIKHGSGGAMLKNPLILGEYCRKIASILPGNRLSVKIRSGFSSADEMELIIPALLSSGVVEKIFFHYRTVLENYSPAPLPFREERIARAVQLCGSVPLIANGDICSVDEAKNVMNKTGASGVMIARPWLRDPYLLRRFFDPDTPDAEKGRGMFFEALKQSGINGGALVELAKLLWGRDSEEFQQTVKEQFA